MRCLLPLVLAAAGCDLPPSPQAASQDASRLFDVELPNEPLPDGFILSIPPPTEDPANDATSSSSAAPSSGSSSAPASTSCSSAGGLDGGSPLDGPAWYDAAPDASLCTTPLAAGDLVFDEVMIASVSGSDDRGQWLEVENTKGCAVDLVGVTATAPHGQSTHTMTITSDVWLPAGGFFLVADTTDSSENNGLPGLVFAWAGSPADALHKTSDTITLTVGDITLDTLSYPSKTRPAGTSIAFPADCSVALRGDFTNWLPSTASWAPGFFGTPGAPNDDVTCTVPPLPSCASPRRSPRPR